MRLLHLVNPRKAVGLFTIAVLVLAAALYIIFDFYLNSVGKEIAGSWLQSEAVTIQEGNLLSSISKNQRVLLSSQFVKGVQLIDTSTSENQPLIEFGEQFIPALTEQLKLGSLYSFADGFLTRQVLYRVPERPDLILSFRTHSDFLTRSYLAAVAVFMFFLLFLFVNIRKVESRRIAAENKNRILLGEVAARVAHDIRSPLNTLNAVLETIDGLSPDSKRLLTTAIQRIREIASGIADQNRLAQKESGTKSENSVSNNGQTEPTLLFTLIQELIEEKRTHYPNRATLIQWKTMTESYSQFAAVNPSEFKRSLSNLIDNAVEASPIETPVVVSLGRAQEHVTVEITDCGRGIPSKHLSRIGEKGFSHGKERGSGLGVYYAKKSIEAWGGKFSIQSEAGKGTTVRISIPQVTAPAWYTGSIPLGDSKTVIIVDDDPTIHALWQDRLKQIGSEVMIEHFFDPDSAISWIVQNRRTLGKYLLLTDYNLNSQAGDGITVLERFGVCHPGAVMVTSAFDDRSVRDRCGKLNVKILPKPVMNFAPILVG